MDLELLGLDESALGEPVADLLTLVALELKDLSVLGVLHYGAIAGKLLENTRNSQEWANKDKKKTKWEIIITKTATLRHFLTL